MTTDDARTRMIGRFRLVTILIPAVLTLAAVLTALLLAPTLPAPVAIHWNAAGTPDGFAPLWLVIAVMVLAGFGLPALIGRSALPGLRLGDQGVTYRFFGAFAVGLSTMIVVLSTWSLVLQRGLADAALAPTLTPAVLGSAVLALVAGAAGWVLQPHLPVKVAQEQDAEPLALGEGEQVAWMRTTSIGRLGLGVLGAAIVAMVLGTLAAWVLPAEPAVPWVMTSALVLLVVAVALTSAFRVRADRNGLTVTSLIGLPRMRVPIAQIAGVGVRQVNPVGEFGGVGLRLAPGRFGVVMRSGEAIGITRTGGRQFVVTVDDAATAVAVLSAYHARAGAARE